MAAPEPAELAGLATAVEVEVVVAALRPALPGDLAEEAQQAGEVAVPIAMLTPLQAAERQTLGLPEGQMGPRLAPQAEAEVEAAGYWVTATAEAPVPVSPLVTAEAVAQVAVVEAEAVAIKAMVPLVVLVVTAVSSFTIRQGSGT